MDGFQGINSLVIKIRDAQVIADLMLGGAGEPKDEELNEIHISAVQEAMNQMMGSSATSMSTIFNRFVNISPPGIDILNMSSGEGVGSLPDDETLIRISFRLKIGDLIDSTIMQLLPVQFAKDMVSMLLGDVSPAEEEAAVTMAETPAMTNSAEHHLQHLRCNRRPHSPQEERNHHIHRRVCQRIQGCQKAGIIILQRVCQRTECLGCHHTVCHRKGCHMDRHHRLILRQIAM